MAHKFPSGFFVVDVNDLLIPVAVIKSALLLLSTRHNNNGGSHIKELAQDIHPNPELGTEQPQIFTCPVRTALLMRNTQNTVST